MKVCTRPRTWGPGVGMFLLFTLGFQIFLWRQAIQDPRNLHSDPSGRLVRFILDETPLAVAIVSCLLLRFGAPKDEG